MRESRGAGSAVAGSGRCLQPSRNARHCHSCGSSWGRCPQQRRSLGLSPQRTEREAWPTRHRATAHRCPEVRSHLELRHIYDRVTPSRLACCRPSRSRARDCHNRISKSHHQSNQLQRFESQNALCRVAVGGACPNNRGQAVIDQIFGRAGPLDFARAGTCARHCGSNSRQWRERGARRCGRRR